MKVCFSLQGRFVQLGHAMVLQLQEEMPGAHVSAFVQSRPGYEYLLAQKDISYGTLVLEEEVHRQYKKDKLDHAYLAKLEADYGIPNLWPYLYIDRVVMSGQYLREYPYDTPALSRHDMQLLLQRMSKEVLALLDKEQPDAIVFHVIGSVGSMLLYHIAKKRGIKTLVIKATRIGNGTSFTEDYRTLTYATTRFTERLAKQLPVLEEATEFLRSFRERPTPYVAQFSPTYNNQTARSANLRFLRLSNLGRSMWWHLESIAADLTKGAHDYSDIRMGWQIWDKCKRKMRGVIGYDGLWQEPRDERFAFYPLHLEPETSLLLDSPHHTDQLVLIKAAARSLPIDMMLYVKEHPQMVGYRPRAYYRALAKIPNVRLIRPSTLGYPLIQKSELVLTITGTAGFEALLLKKPVITFGNIYFNDFPAVLHMRSLEELPHLVLRQLEGYRHDDQTLLQYISALIEESVDVEFADIWGRNESAETIAKNKEMRLFTRYLSKKIAV